MGPRRILFLLGVAGAILAYWLLRYDAHRLDNLGTELTEVYRACSHYVRDHDGSLPESMEELVQQGYIRQVRQEGRVLFLGPSVREGECIPVYDGKPIALERFKMGASGSIKAFEIRDGLAYEAGGREALAVIIPSRLALMDFSRKLTAKLILNIDTLAKTGQPDDSDK